MDINKYSLFVDISETKNFTKTGNRKGYTQPGVSHILKSMETELGIPLFNRTHQGIQLTSYAEAILPIVRNLLAVNEQLEQTISALKGLDTGHLTIASYASISRNWLPAVINAFRTDYPGIEIQVIEGGTDDIVKCLTDNAADIGLLSKRHTEPLEWIPLYEDPLVAILPKSYEYPKEAFSIPDMAGKTFIMSAIGTDYDVHHALDKQEIRPDIRLTSTDDLAVVAMVANNLGVSILPWLAVKGMDSSVNALPLDPPCTRQLGIAFRSDVSLSPAARRFIDKVKSVLIEMELL